MHPGVDGMAYIWSNSAHTQGRMGRQSRADHFLMSVTLAGEAHLAHGHDGMTTISPQTGMVLVDIAQDVRTTVRDGHSHAYLTLPRTMVKSLTGSSALRAAGGVLPLPGAGLFAFLRTHMEMLHRHRRELSAVQTRTALRVAGALAVDCLECLDADREAHKHSTETMFAAANDTIQRRLADPDLCADGIAILLGCSRAHLYRVFDSYDLSIGQAIRDARMERARALIAKRPGSSLEEIGVAVGYASQAGFSRAFRNAFGFTPREWRALLKQGNLTDEPPARPPS
jgi:AraC-like DNA-binding protein